MTPKPSSLLKTISFCCMLAIIGCHKNDPAPTPPVNPVVPQDTTIITHTPIPIDSAMMLYVGRSQSLYAVNAQTGSVKWSTNLGDIVRNSPLYYQGMIYVATGDLQNAVLHAVDSNGKEQWSASLSSSIGASNVYADNGMIYANTLFTPPSAYDAKTGALRWTYPAAGLVPSGAGGDISLTNGVLYFTNGLNVHAIDASTGNKIWEIDDQTNIPPAVTGGKVITAFGGTVTAFDRQTTSQIWQQNIRRSNDPSINSLSVNAALGNIYVYQGVFLDVLDTATGSIKFTIDMSGLLNVSITSTDSLLFVCSALGIYCYNSYNGASLWQVGEALQPTDYYGYPNLSAVTCLNNQMFFNYDLLYAITTKTRQTLWKALLENNDGWSYSTPCLVTKNGKVYRGGNNF